MTPFAGVAPIGFRPAASRGPGKKAPWAGADAELCFEIFQGKNKKAACRTAGLFRKELFGHLCCFAAKKYGKISKNGSHRAGCCGLLAAVGYRSLGRRGIISPKAMRRPGAQCRSRGSAQGRGNAPGSMGVLCLGPAGPKRGKPVQERPSGRPAVRPRTALRVTQATARGHSDPPDGAPAEALCPPKTMGAPGLWHRAAFSTTKMRGVQAGVALAKTSAPRDSHPKKSNGVPGKTRQNAPTAASKKGGSV